MKRLAQRPDPDLEHDEVRERGRLNPGDERVHGSRYRYAISRPAVMAPNHRSSETTARRECRDDGAGVIRCRAQHDVSCEDRVPQSQRDQTELDVEDGLSGLVGRVGDEEQDAGDGVQHERPENDAEQRRERGD